MWLMKECYYSAENICVNQFLKILTCVICSFFFLFSVRGSIKKTQREQSKRQTESVLIKGHKDLSKINMFWDTMSVQRNQERLNCPDCVSCQKSMISHYSK